MKQQENPQSPDWKLDHQGRMVPLANIEAIDLERDRLVLGIIGRAKSASQQLATLKVELFSDIQAFIETSAAEYGAKVGGGKGNVTLFSFDGRYKVQRAFQDSITFDERLQAAKALIDTCLQRWSEGARPELKVIINDAFQVDQEGNINTGRVLGLRRLKIDDEEWVNAMRAIGDAVQVTGSKSYVRVYERIGTTDRYRAIPLDLASA